MSELLLGCGRDRRKLMDLNKNAEWKALTTLDLSPDVGADVVHDLNDLPYPFDSESFDEIHAYEVLEHCGIQGDWRFFFDQFTEFHRILKPSGLFYATVPSWNSCGAWGDPGHTRVINEMSINFLQQSSYDEKGRPTTDYRSAYKVDWQPEIAMHQHDRFIFALRKI